MACATKSSSYTRRPALAMNAPVSEESRMARLTGQRRFGGGGSGSLMIGEPGELGKAEQLATPAGRNWRINHHGCDRSVPCRLQGKAGHPSSARPAHGGPGGQSESSIHCRASADARRSPVRLSSTRRGRAWNAQAAMMHDA